MLPNTYLLFIYFIFIHFENFLLFFSSPVCFWWASPLPININYNLNHWHITKYNNMIYYFYVVKFVINIYLSLHYTNNWIQVLIFFLVLIILFTFWFSTKEYYLILIVMYMVKIYEIISCLWTEHENAKLGISSKNSL